MGVEIVLGTTNPAKARSLAWLVEGLGLSCRTAEGLGAAPVESGHTLAENARLKALHWSRCANGLAIASDGGLHIPALGSAWDPLHTHRFAGPQATDEERARALLVLMRELRGPARRAFFVEAVALAFQGDLLAEWEAKGQEGHIVEAVPARIVPGFWADSLLVYSPDGSGRERSPGATPGESGAWTKLRPLVQAFLRHWLAAREPGESGRLRPS